MNKKERMLKKFYRNKVDSTYYDLLNKIKNLMQQSDKYTYHYYKGKISEAKEIVEKLKKDGFEVRLKEEPLHINEHEIKIKWLD